MKENKYGHLLDEYINNGSSDSNKIVHDFKNRKEEEGKDRYGTLVDNVDRFPTIYDKILDVEMATRRMNQEEAEEQAKHEQEIKAKREREKQELEARIDKNTAFVEDYLAKKEAEQKAIEEKKKKEAEQAEIYRNIEKMMQTCPKAAEAYVEIYAKKLKMI